jgi:glutamate-1-semialdehyde 2,1-aminomutase
VAGRLAEVLTSRAGEAGVPVTVQRVGTMLTPFFTTGPVRNYADAPTLRSRRLHPLLPRHARGRVYFPPSPFEAAFASTEHGDRELAAVDAALAGLWRR